MPTYSAAVSIPATDKDVPLSLFGGANTELSPTDLPEGGSPQGNDVEFLPGSVQTRRGTHGILVAPAPDDIVYLKTYVQPNGVPITLFLDFLGDLWVEYPTISPGVKTILRGLQIYGLYAQSVTAFGREYIALSDGYVGADIPLQYDGTYLDRVSQDGPGAPPAITDAAPLYLTISSISGQPVLTISSAIENGTLITITTTTPHGLYVGDYVSVFTGNSIINNAGQPIGVQAVNSANSFSYEVGVTGLPAQTSGQVFSLAATLVTSGNHGLLTGDSFIIYGTGTPYDNNYNQIINGASTNISSIQQITGSTTAYVVTATAHGLNPGDLITVFTGTAGYDQSGTLFPILSADSPTTLTYDTGLTGLSTLTSGTVTQRINVNSPENWNVRTVVNSTTLTFTCSSVVGGLVHTGTFRGGGLSQEGAHKCVVMFQTRQGYITAPSPPITFGSFGNGKYSVSNLPIGPPNVVARVLALTGSGGDNFFTVPETPMGTDITGARVPIGTSTVINDNTSTSAVLDVADNTLFAATGIDIPGNNLFAQVVLGPCLGFASYGSRLLAWGERNKIQNLLNMGFAGGYVTANQPLGWTLLTGGGTIVNSDVGWAWRVAGNHSGASGEIQQSAYQDWTGAAILTENQNYTFRLRAISSDVSDPGYIVATISSVSAAFSSTATINLSAVGLTLAFYQANFTLAMPAVIPPDMKLTIAVWNQSAGQYTQIDELEIIPAQNPYRNNVARGSYVNNPEAFDGVTGNFGPVDDPSPMQCMTLIRNNLIMHTAEGTSSTSDNGQEPSGWTVNSISRAVGALSFRSCDANKTGTGDAGEEWEVVASLAGLYIFAGGEFYKISQEYQSQWNRINWNARGTLWVKNDTSTRLVTVGVPLDGATTCTNMFVMSYRDLDTGTQIGNTPAIRIGFTGRMIATDVSRKWTTWNLPMQCGQILQRPQGPLLCVGGTVGQFYYFDPAKLTDDDYGQIFSSWTSYFFVNHDQEIQLGVGSHVKLFAYLTALAQGTGQIMVTPYVNSLLNAWPATPLITLPSVPTQDLEWPLNTIGERCAFKFSVFPLAGQTDAAFQLNKMVVTLRENALWSVRGRL